MENSIGEYIRVILRHKKIKNEVAGACVGISESAFEKTLSKDDIYALRLLQLSNLTNENLFEYYNQFEPIKSFRQKEIDQWQSKINTLSAELDSIKILLESKDRLIAMSDKRLLDQEDIIKLLKEKGNM